jgi:hypothetical protein
MSFKPAIISKGTSKIIKNETYLLECEEDASKHSCEVTQKPLQMPQTQFLRIQGINIDIQMQEFT